jgi:hypothetical protein
MSTIVDATHRMVDDAMQVQIDEAVFLRLLLHV